MKTIAHLLNYLDLDVHVPFGTSGDEIFPLVTIFRHFFDFDHLKLKCVRFRGTHLTAGRMCKIADIFINYHNRCHKSTTTVVDCM